MKMLGKFSHIRTWLAGGGLVTGALDGDLTGWQRTTVMCVAIVVYAVLGPHNDKGDSIE